MAVEWVERDGKLVATYEGENVIWAPQPGSQEAFLECPVFECLYEGTRGPGKTDALLMSFAQHVGKGYGPNWRGIIFRKTYKQLADVVKKSKQWFPKLWPSACFNSTDMAWRWATGEELRLAYMEREDDYDNYHGHEYPWIAFEELTTWPDDKCYRRMMSCCRSAQPGMPRMYRATTNPYGVGHNWVRQRFGLPVPPNQIIGRVIRDAESGEERVAIHGNIHENKILLHADPKYPQKIAMAARNEAEKKAWLEGSWDIVAGGMFDDVWAPAYHVLPNFPLGQIPPGWRLNRSYDHGQSKPFSVGWWAQSDGCPMQFGDYTIGAVPGDIIRIAEWYGWNGTPNEGLRLASTEIAKGIIERERDWGIYGHVSPGPADTQIFTKYEPNKSVAGDMKRHGVTWTEADKGPGSREQGWQQIRELLKGAIPNRQGIREKPGMFICQRCESTLRTFPVLPRDSKKIDDVDTEAEDHIADEMRYRVRERRRAAQKWSWT